MNGIDITKISDTAMKEARVLNQRANSQRYHRVGSLFGSRGGKSEMKTYQGRKNVLLEIVLLIVVVSFVSLSIQNGDGSQVKRQKSVKEPESYNGPVVDYDASPRISSLTDQKEYALNQAKSNRYNHRAPQPLGEFASVIFEIHTHWNVGLAPLPINASDIIVLGKVVDAQAYLSADRAGVYSGNTSNDNGYDSLGVSKLLSVTGRAHRG